MRRSVAVRVLGQWLVGGLGLCGCTPSLDDTAGVDSSQDSASGCITASGAYAVAWQTDPTPITAMQEADFSETVYGPDGCPVQDLQINHERIVHNIFISKDLESFQHLHMEDTYPLTADALRDATFHLPLTLPFSGQYRLMFDYAHENQWIQTDDWLDAAGDLPQLPAPVPDWATTWSGRGLEVELIWDTPPVAGYESQWRLHITEGGVDVTDLVQYLGADAHAVLVSEDAAWGAHTHAWVPGLENMSPDMSMDHLYPGPELPFHFTFPAAGNYKVFSQFTRAAAPDSPILVPFWVEVSP